MAAAGSSSDSSRSGYSLSESLSDTSQVGAETDTTPASEISIAAVLANDDSPANTHRASFRPTSAWADIAASVDGEDISMAPSTNGGSPWGSC